MKVYGSIASPFVQRVLMAARLKGHDLVAEAPPGGSMRSPEFQAISPLGRIPVAETADGRHICESEAIAAYVEEALPGPSLLPGDAYARAHAREIAALALCELAGGMRPVMVHLVFRVSEAPEVVAAARSQIDRGLDAIERVRDPDAAFAAGDAPGWADCLLAPALALMTALDPIAGTGAMIAACPGLAAYRDRARAHPVVGRSVAEMEAGFADILARNA